MIWEYTKHGQNNAWQPFDEPKDCPYNVSLGTAAAQQLSGGVDHWFAIVPALEEESESIK
jgi:hypothetical protein